MATAEEKEAAQAARDVAKASIVQGRERLSAAVPRAGASFPQRRLRASGDLSRYAIGGFLSDALPPVAPVAPRPTGGGAGTMKAKPKAVAPRKTTATTPVVRALPARGVRTSTLVGAEEARYINRGVGVRPTGPSRR